MKNHISVYLKAGRNAATSYYRFYQFFDRINEKFVYHLMIPDKLWNSFFPIAKQKLFKRVFIFLYIYIRVLANLFKDAIIVPKFIIISRCLINRVFPLSYKLLLLMAKKRGSVIIFDFDDPIIVAKEVSREGFDFFTRISDVIVAGSPFLIDLIDKKYSEKAIYLPTTDGDIFSLVSGEITKQRMKSLDNQINIVWVGSFSGLIYLKSIMPALEETGSVLSKDRKQLVLKVVCDDPLVYTPSSFILENIKWTRAVAIETMLGAHIGIMPLEDNESTRGKCSFKLIQYLSAGLPIIGTNVGMNKIVLRERVGVGLQNNNKSEWEPALLGIIKDKKVWLEYSKNATQQWHDSFNYTTNLKDWNNIIQSAE